jgi:hypothetical protein
MTGLLVYGMAVSGDDARPALGVEWSLAAQHGEREPVRAVADGDQGDQRRRAAGQQLAPVGNEIGVMQGHRGPIRRWPCVIRPILSRLIPLRDRARPADS